MNTTAFKRLRFILHDQKGFKILVNFKIPQSNRIRHSRSREKFPTRRLSVLQALVTLPAVRAFL